MIKKGKRADGQRWCRRKICSEEGGGKALAVRAPYPRRGRLVSSYVCLHYEKHKQELISETPEPHSDPLKRDVISLWEHVSVNTVVTLSKYGTNPQIQRPSVNRAYFDYNSKTWHPSKPTNAAFVLL